MNKMIQRSKKLKNRKGFTLIELIVVIVIIGILAAIVIPRLAGFQERAAIKADIATARTLATAASAIYSDELAAADYGTGDQAKIEDLLPDGFSWKTAVDPTDTFDVDVTAEGEVTVLGADGVEAFPDASAYVGGDEEEEEEL